MNYPIEMFWLISSMFFLLVTGWYFFLLIFKKEKFNAFFTLCLIMAVIIFFGLHVIEQEKMFDKYIEQHNRQQGFVETQPSTQPITTSASQPTD